MVEGEKTRDALVDAGLPALGTVTGASGTPGPDVMEVLRDRRVCLWPDSDDPGRGHMERIAERLGGVAAEVLVYTWHESPEKGDSADHPAIQSKDPKAVDRLLTDLEEPLGGKVGLSPRRSRGQWSLHRQRRSYANLPGRYAPCDAPVRRRRQRQP